MKITVEIPDDKVGDLMQFVAAIKSANIADDRERIVPVPGRRYRTREGNVTVASEIVQPHDRILTFVRGDFDLPFYYERNGLPCGGCGPEWDIVEDIGPVTP